MLASTGFARERVVTPGARGPNRLDVDVALLAKAQPDLRDLRLHDAQDRELGYLLVPPPPPVHTWAGGSLLPVASTKNTSGFELDLGRPLLVDRLKLEGIAAPFLKRATLEGSGDRARWTLLADATVFDLPDQDLRHVEVGFDAGTYRYVRVTWDDRSSARVTPASAAAREASVNAAAATVFGASFAKRTSEPRKSRYRIVLPGARLPIAAIEVDVAGGNVFRTATLTEPRLGRNEVAPVRLGSATLKRTERDGIVAAEMVVPISAPEGRELDLVIEDGNNPPLEITAIRARLAPQPWIYFESPDGAPLHARYGGQAATPLYDLEASRPGVESRQTATAAWGKTIVASKIERSPGVAIPLGGQLARDQFRVSRKVQDGKAGLSVLLLDAHVLARSNDLADVRIADAEGRQVPYLVEDRAEPLAVKLSVPERTAEGRSSIYRLELPYDTWPSGTRLVLATDARVFDREVVVRRVPDNHRNRRAEAIASSPWRSADPELPPPAFEAGFVVRDARAIEVVIDEGDNAPLPITSAQLLLPSRALRFYHSGAPLYLLYGNRRAGAPRYDIALLAPRLFGEPARELTLSATIDERGDEDTSGRKWFWIAIVVAAVVLVAMLVRLVLVSGETSRAPGDST
ncbi:MAG TPA: DUF3999 family protein [Thermoanaerobaculia bacterium]|nr:DUF3999 family protein [Thermoanaerobaculia bacterium]